MSLNISTEEMINDLFMPTYSDINDPSIVLESFNNDLLSIENTCINLALQISSNISQEGNIFQKMWDVIVNIVKKIVNHISNFFKSAISFLKKLSESSNDNKDIKHDDINSVMNDQVFKDRVSTIINGKNNTSTEFINDEKNNGLVVILPGKEGQFINTLAFKYKANFIPEFRKILFSINSVSSSDINPRTYLFVRGKITDLKDKADQYKDKTLNIVKDLGENKVKYLTVITSDTGKDFIEYALRRTGGMKWTEQDIMKSLEPKNCTRMLNDLIGSIETLKHKTETKMSEWDLEVKHIMRSLNVTIAATSSVFSECFKNIKIYIVSEHTLSRITRLANQVIKSRQI